MLIDYPLLILGKHFYNTLFNLLFVIYKLYISSFNQIDLPQYLSYEDLRSNLFKAISECSTGFAFQ